MELCMLEGTATNSRLAKLEAKLIGFTCSLIRDDSYYSFNSSSAKLNLNEIGKAHFFLFCLVYMVN